MSDPIVTAAPWWAQYAGGVVVALIGSGALLTESIRKLRSGYGKAEARKLNAEAIVDETSVSALRESRSVDYERMLNERTFKNMDMLVTQINHLSELVDAQSESLRIQSQKMDHMEKEIVSLREALDTRTEQLKKVKLHFPPVCRACEYFNGDSCTIPGLHCKLTPIKSELPIKNTNI